jgi:hypothetical protein
MLAMAVLSSEEDEKNERTLKFKPATRTATRRLRSTSTGDTEASARHLITEMARRLAGPEHLNRILQLQTEKPHEREAVAKLVFRLIVGDDCTAPATPVP